MPDKHENHDDDADLPRRYSESDSQRLIESHYISDEIRAKASYITVKALGDLSPVCEMCGEICDEHSIKLRDAFMSRAFFLSGKLNRGLGIYLQEREFGVSIPAETINAIYRIWAEMVLLHELIEPQMREEDDEDLAGEEDSEH
jgi:hypothetical protein